MANTESMLRHLGFTDTEIQIYVAGRRLGQASISLLNADTGIKRPTIYHALETMSKKGVAIPVHDAHKLTYEFSDDTVIARLGAERFASEAQRWNALTASDNSLPVKELAKSANLVGKAELKSDVESILRQALDCSGRHWDILSPNVNFMQSLTPGFKSEFLQIRKQSKITSRSLWEERSNRKLTASEIRLRAPRILPSTLHGAFSYTLILFDESAAIIPARAEKKATICTLAPTVGLYQEMFNALWTISKPIVQML